MNNSERTFFLELPLIIGSMYLCFELTKIKTPLLKMERLKAKTKYQIRASFVSR